ncbi:aldo/keto reductase [Pedobacter sp. NJ-S-72]
MKSYRADEAYYDYTLDGMNKKSVENSLKTLGISVIDVLFLHDPAAVPQDRVEEILKQMLYFKQCGYARKIGLGGNAPLWFKPYLTSGVFDVFMEYNRLNATCIDALDTSISFCLENKKEYYAASPLHMGLLGKRFSEFTKSPPDWLDVENIAHAKRPV